ncbi:MAG: hypothetical protein A2Z35_05895 [Actinobacteria bacterium RBG_19FT_COMBO_36_27]|nr:MAG: hypothetical protein A2Z35_05895 [Actinobacteria bacterium RBG_19FT_COMBO_36_27]
MELKDSNYEYWNLQYWEGFSCICGNVELIYYSEDEYRNRQQKAKKINQYDYMKICPNCKSDLIEDIGLEGFSCKNYKCKRFYTFEELYEMKTGGLELSKAFNQGSNPFSFLKLPKGN